MGKNTFFTGQPIFNQILSLIPRSLVSRLSRIHKTDRYCKKFRTYDHLVTMLYSSLHQCNSLREVITGMQATASRLRHLGIGSTPRRSTLADANERRCAGFFEDLYHRIYQRYYGSLPDSLSNKKLIDRLFIIDSTIISLFSTVMQSSGSYGCNGKKKGGIKAHVMLRAKQHLPCLVRLTEGKVSDTKFLSSLVLPPGSIIVMDKIYRNFKQFIEWTSQKVTWVTRLHGHSVYKIKQARTLTAEHMHSGVQKDLIIELGNPQTVSINPIQTVRLVIFRDPVHNRRFEFITNNMKLDPQTIADIYKKRWQIELLFKRLKQNFQLHFFLGDNENAIRIQVWCALIADLLVKIIKDKVSKRKKWSMANLCSLIRLHLGTYISLHKFLINPEKALLFYEDPLALKQMSLFEDRIRGA